MNTGIQYDEAWTNRIETIYNTPDIVAQRQAILQLLNLQPGESVADIGSGPGLLAYEMARKVGANGRIAGVDISENMNQLAANRCESLPWVSFHLENASQLPFSTGEFDKAVSTQVYEYVENIQAALSELHRILKPGGTAVILDSDWGSLVWNTSNLSRMKQILEIFDQHCAHPFLARQLLPLLQECGLEFQSCHVHTILNLDHNPNSYSHGLIEFISAYVTDNSDYSESEIDAWATELKELSIEGSCFFSLNRYIFVAFKPESDG